MGGALMFVFLLGGLHLLVSRGVDDESWTSPALPPKAPALPLTADRAAAPFFPPVPSPLYRQMGRLHFGIILGWSVVHSMVLYFIVTQLAGVDVSEAKGLDLYSVCCLVGYCMLPICAQSAACLFIPRSVLCAVKREGGGRRQRWRRRRHCRRARTGTLFSTRGRDVVDSIIQNTSLGDVWCLIGCCVPTCPSAPVACPPLVWRLTLGTALVCLAAPSPAAPPSLHSLPALPRHPHTAFCCRGVLSIGLAIFAALWAGVTAAKLLVRRCSALEDLQGVITFPCVLTYSTFALLALY